jgi:[ribosomal protein S5]-alanine N-acetyltransferase
MQLNASQRWRGERVELFLMQPALVSDTYVAWLNDSLVNRYLESRFVAHDIASTCRFVEAALADEHVLFLGIRSIELDRHVGNIKLGPIDPHHGFAEIGIMIGDRSAWGRGIACAAIERIADIARDELRLRKLSAGCYASNVGSARAFQKAGFTVEGRRSAHYLLGGCAEDAVILGRLL